MGIGIGIYWTPDCMGSQLGGIAGAGIGACGGITVVAVILVLLGFGRLFFCVYP